MTQGGVNLDLMEPAFCSGRRDVSRSSQSNSSAQKPKEKELGLEGN